MSIHKSHWYQIGVNYLIEGSPIPIPFVVFMPTPDKYENINKSMVIQFADFAADHIQKNNPQVNIQNLIATSVSYLGHMSNEEFYSN
ncbi:hypothetical protein MW341_003290 [Acinetobacter baumannii]|nr:hypothetical protein [Acinetobacter baumannii]